MKKLISVALMLAMLLGLTAFASAEGDAFELALCTDLGTIDDKSFNQGSWEGLEQYALEYEKTYKYYQPAEQTTDAYMDAIELAAQGGAKVIVTPGFLWEPAIFVAQDMYPDIHFILIDGAPNNGDYANWVEKTGENTVGVKYAEEESGFLAGYAAVKEGYTKLGFMGGMAVPAVVRYGYGFVQGAEYAATEMGIEAITVNYHYTGNFDASPEAQALAASWYNDGVEVIFACGGSVGSSVMTAAEAAEGKWVIGVDVDQSGESTTVITSAMKGLRASVYQAIDALYKDAFPGGETWILAADRDGVGLPMETSQFATFTQADYDAIYAKLVAKEITLKKDTDVTNAAEVATGIAQVTVVE